MVVIGKENAWGGQWVKQYDYVRLHQPYTSFTAGGRKWDLDVPESHLASKPEILRHFINIREACVAEKGLDLIELFEYECVSCEAAHGDTGVQVVAKSLKAVPLPTVCVTAEKVIRATGFKIEILKPFEFSAGDRVHSLAAVDALTPEWNMRMRFSQNSNTPIYVIGSGKTAMDAIYHLSKRLPGVKERLRCISGSGTWFMRRDTFNPTYDQHWWKLNMYGNNTYATATATAQHRYGAPSFQPHFQLVYGVVADHRCILPYKYR